MQYKKEIMKIMEEHPNYRETLFIRGYLITDSKINLEKYPFYNNWISHKLGISQTNEELKIYYHKLQKCEVYEDPDNNISMSIIGHAYNPFSMEYKEKNILKKLLNCYKKSMDNFINLINELTGVHLIIINDNGKIIAVQDCCGFKSCYFGMIDGYTYVTSHPQLVGDLLNLEINDYIKKLVTSKMYNIGNKYLPGNKSPYDELKRLGPNTYLEKSDNFIVKRFYPRDFHFEVENESEYVENIEKAHNILFNNIKLAAMKWKKPAISMSGGMDSKTTLASANGLYDKFKYFSFHSKPAEVTDAKAAREICDTLNLIHEIYPIPDSNEEVKDYEIFKKIINHNSSHIINQPENEIRKMITLYHKDDFDVELKSWASEVGRVTLENKYGVNMPNTLSERHFSIFQTRYFMTPFLLKKSDSIYRDFLKEIKLNSSIFNYAHADLYHWEIKDGSWGSSVVTALDLSHEVTMPFNNRILLETLLSFPHNDRKNDLVHKAIIKKSNRKIADIDLTIDNSHVHPYRKYFEKAYYYYRTFFYR